MTVSSPTTASVLWFASYPKSGNTWVRTILGYMLAPKDSIFETIPSFNKEYPDSAPILPVLGQKTKIIKTHLMPQHPRMSACPDQTIGVVTIYRHPLDVLLSALNYARIKTREQAFINDRIKTVEQIVEDGEFDYYIDQFVEQDGFSQYSRMSGSFDGYIEKWRGVAAGKPYHEIRYENLFANPVQGIMDLARFLERDLDEDEVMVLPARVEGTTKQDDRFYWKRRAQNYERMLPPKLVDRFERNYAKTLQKMGYL